MLLGFFAVTVVMVGTAWLTHLRGLQAALVDPWVTWLAPYYPTAAPIPWLTALLLYDLPLLVGAAVGLAIVVQRNRPFDHFLLWWAALAALPLLAQPPNPVPYLLVWAVPLALLAGVALGALPALGWTWRSFGQSTVLVALVVVDACYAVNTLRLILSMATVPGAAADGREEPGAQRCDPADPARATPGAPRVVARGVADAGGGARRCGASP